MRKGKRYLIFWLALLIVLGTIGSPLAGEAGAEPAYAAGKTVIDRVDVTVLAPLSGVQYDRNIWADVSTDQDGEEGPCAMTAANSGAYMEYVASTGMKWHETMNPEYTASTDRMAVILYIVPVDKNAYRFNTSSASTTRVFVNNREIPLTVKTDTDAVKPDDDYLTITEDRITLRYEFSRVELLLAGNNLDGAARTIPASMFSVPAPKAGKEAYNNRDNGRYIGGKIAEDNPRYRIVDQYWKSGSKEITGQRFEAGKTYTWHALVAPLPGFRFLGNNNSNYSPALVNESAADRTYRYQGALTKYGIKDATGYIWVEKDFTIEEDVPDRKDLAGAKVEPIADRTYNGTAQEPALTVTFDSKTLTRGVDYTASYTKNTNAGTALIKITGTGGYTGTLYAGFRIKPLALAETAVPLITAQDYTGSEIKPVKSVTMIVGTSVKTLQEGTDYTVTYRDNIDPGTAQAVVTGKGNYTGTLNRSFLINRTEATPASFTRYFGKNRYETSFQIANQLKKEYGVEKFDAICVADGRNYPDALAGVYLAKVKKAPILVTHPDRFTETASYIKANLKAGGRVYILGGPASVPEGLPNMLKASGIAVKRLGGLNRYETNLLILQEAKPTETEFIVATGYDPYDALAASAAGRPILLGPTDAIRDSQKEYLQGLKNPRFYIIGGPQVVNTRVEYALRQYGQTSRLLGADSYERSLRIAQAFFGTSWPHINLASGENYADALCGGPLAIVQGGPLILGSNEDKVVTAIQDRATDNNTYQASVYGGPVWISDANVKKIIGQK
ncbi:MAG: cell wall-binding repeat-containing protein [Firmicutes bacterium]|nr:cell wall-binding repeat-containing protein [Bacillota bacterium]